MGRMAERVPVVQRKPQSPAKRSPGADKHSRSTARPQSGGALAGLVSKPVSEAAGALPARLRAGVEGLSGIAMDDVRVHRNSDEPAKLGALAFTRGTEIHLGPGQEEHLPHEAWHVVQQKQGRVQATTQMKGAAVNEDARLEREADEVASTKLTVTPDRPEKELLRVGSAGRQVTQAKMQWNGNPLHYDPAHSQVTNYLIALSDTYMLRKDVSPKQRQIHVLNMAKKYLLGEAHNASDFDAEAKLWPGVTLMTEGYKRIPHEAEDTSGMFDPPRRWDQQPIDSSHAYLFISVIQLLNNLEDVLRDIDKDKADDRTPQGWYGDVKDALSSLDDIRIMYVDYYKPFIETFETKFEPKLRKTKGAVPPRIAMIHALSSKLRKSYWTGWKPGSEILALTRSLGTIMTVIGAPGLPKKGWSKDVGIAIADQLPFLKQLAKDLVPLLTTDTKEAATIEALIPTPTTLVPRDPSFVILTARNRTMIESVRSEPAPALVRLGDAHVDPVAAGVGPDALKVHAPKKMSDVNLDKMA